MGTKPKDWGRERPLEGAELVEEFDWMCKGGTHPLVACEALHRTPDTLERLAYRYRRGDLARLIRHARHMTHGRPEDYELLHEDVA